MKTFHGSTYRRQSLSKTLLKWWLLFFVAFFIFLILWFASNQFEQSTGESSTIVDEVKEIPYLNNVLWFRSFVMAIFFSAFVLLVFYTLQKDKRIITHLTFDDDDQVLSVGADTIAESRFFMIPYQDLTIDEDDCRESYKGKTYKAIAVKQKETLVGYILRDHYTWSRDDIAQIEASIREVKNL